MARLIALPLAALALFAACDRRPEAPTAADNRRLDEAEGMLNEAPDALDAIDDGALIEKNSAGPNVSAETPEPADLVYPDAP